MSSWWSALGLGAVVTAMLVGCATPYGEADPPEATAATPANEPEAKSGAKKVAKASEAPAAVASPAADATPGPTKSTVTAAPPSIDFTWNRVSDTAEYSLDVLLKDRTTIGPCIGVTWLHRALSTTFRGDCPSSDAYPTVAMSDIEGFQICSAENDDWSHATCTRAMWDGAASTVTFDN